MNIKELGIQHVAIIMDGNGRWATEKNLDRTAGMLQVNMLFQKQSTGL